MKRVSSIFRTKIVRAIKRTPALFLLFILLIANSHLAVGQTLSGSDSLRVLLLEASSDTVKVKILQQLLISNAINKQTDSALALGTRANILAHDNQWSKGIISSHKMLGRLYQINQNEEQFIFHWEQALEETKRIEDFSASADILSYMGQHHEGINDFESADERYAESVEFYLKAEMPARAGESLIAMANMEFGQSHFPDALKHYLSALDLFKGEGNKEGEIDVLYSIGNVYLSQGEFPRTLKYYFESLGICKELDIREPQAKILGGMGNVYMDQRDYEMALERYQEALAIEKEIGDQEGIAAKLGNIGNVYHALGALDHDQGALDRALEAHTQALEINRVIGSLSGIADNLNNLGIVHEEQGDHQKALDNYLEALSIDQQMGDLKAMSIKLGNIGSLYTKLGNYREAKSYLDSALTISHAIGTNHVDWIYEELSLLFENQEDYKMALENFRQSTHWRDTLFNEEKTKEIGSLEARHEIEMEAMERRRQEEEKQRLQKEAKDRRNALQYSGILMVLMVFMTLLLFSGKFKLPLNIVEGGIFFTLLILFEFLLVLFDPFIAKYAGGEPAYSLLINSGLALLILPFHGFFEKLLKKRLQKTRD